MKTFLKSIWSIALLSILLFACDDANEEIGATGNISIVLTDAPFPSDEVSEANIHIERIEIRKKTSVDENEGDDSQGNDDNDGDQDQGNDDNENENNFIILSEEKMSFNLLDLANGVTASLVSSEIEAGSYDLIRLVVSEASIVLEDESVFDLNIPSGAQSGIKVFIKPSIEVAGGLTTELLLDFDVSRSFLVQGNPKTPAGIKGFQFKPTIKAANLSDSGQLMGLVVDESDEPIDGATISVFNADNTLNTTALTNSSGKYTILGLEAGTYSISVEYGDLEKATFEDLLIVPGNFTNQDAKLFE